MANLQLDTFGKCIGGLVYYGIMAPGGHVDINAASERMVQIIVPKTVIDEYGTHHTVIPFVTLAHDADNSGEHWTDNPPECGLVYVYQLKMQPSGPSAAQPNLTPLPKNGLAGLAAPGSDAAPPPAAAPPSPLTASVMQMPFTLLLTKDDPQAFHTNSWNKNVIMLANHKLHAAAIAPGQSTLKLALPDNPLVVLANTANAGAASFFFSQESATQLPQLGTVTDWVYSRIEPHIQQLEMALKPRVTEAMKLQQLQDNGFWAVMPSDNPFLNKAAYEKMTAAMVRTHCIAHDISVAAAGAGSSKATMITRLMAKCAEEAQLRADAVSTALAGVYVDTNPTWVMEFKVSLPNVPGEDRAVGSKAKATDYTTKACSVVWEPGYPEPETSIKVAQRLSNLYKQEDHNREQRYVLIIGWRKAARPPQA